MTPTNRETNSLARRALLAATGVLAGSLLLAGCTTAPATEPSASASPTPTPTASETTEPTSPTTQVDAPTSASEATAAAEATFAQFVDILNAVVAEKGASPERIDAVAVPPASTSVITTAKAIADQGYVVTGGNTSTVKDSSAGDVVADGATIPFGAVTINTCYDSSTRTVTLPSGEAAPTSPNPRSISTATVVYSPAAGAWFVRSLEDSGETC
jgi:hypothetical protein